MRNKVLTELLLDTGWASVSDKRLDRDPITVTRGRGASGGIAGPMATNATLNNTGGVFSPRNAQSVLFGRIGRNTAIRHSLGIGQYGMVVDGSADSNSNATTVDKAQLDIVGDIDIRVDLEVRSPSSWTAGNFDLASKFLDSDPNRSWSLIMIGDKLRFQWFSLGTVASFKSADSVALPGPATGRNAIRVTLDVDNGASGNAVAFYTAPTIAGPWVQLGSTVTQAGTTAIFSGTANLRIGGASNVPGLYVWAKPAWCTYYAAEVRNGINGTLVAAPDFAAQPLSPGPFGTAIFADGLGNDWVFQGDPGKFGRIWWGDVRIRAVAEIAELPPRWDPSHSDKYVPLVANGVLRRYGQGKSPVATGLRDFVLARPQALTSYFPLNGAEGTLYSLNLGATYHLSTRFFPQAVAGSSPLSPVFTYGKDMGASWLGTGMELNATGNSYMRGDCATGDPNAAFDFLFQSQSLGVLTVQLQDYNVNVWSLVLDTSTNDGTLQVSFTDPNVGPIGFLTVGPFTELQDANVHHCRFQLSTVGADTQFAVYIDGVLRSSGTMAAYTWNGTALFRLFYSRYVNQTVMNLAHLILWAEANPANIPAIADVVEAAFGYAGETAGDRITRVCADGNIPLVLIGGPAATTPMGPQFSEPRLAQLRDAEATDFGILTEQRDALGLLYRTRASMYAQTPAVTIDYSAKVVAPPFEPTDDDQSTRNDVTASRRDGGSFQITQTTGRMSISDPPAGIGQYEDEITVNLQTDAQLPGAASWWLRLGTLDAARFPSVTFNLAAAEIDATLRDQLLALDVGDRMLITNIDLADIPDDVDLIVLGSTETFNNSTWSITFNCAPGEPYQVAKFDTARYDADGSVLTAAIGTSDVSFQVSKTGTSLWTVTPAAFPFDINIDGERMTVSGITGATSPQTVAISARSVNGVVKTHPVNAPVRLWDTPRYAY